MCPTPDTHTKKKNTLDVSNPDHNKKTLDVYGVLGQVSTAISKGTCNAYLCPTFHRREVELFPCALPGFQMMVGYNLLRPDWFKGVTYMRATLEFNESQRSRRFAGWKPPVDLAGYGFERQGAGTNKCTLDYLIVY